MSGAITSEVRESPALRVATETDVLVDVMARRIRWAQKVGTPKAAVQVATEFAEHIHQVVAEVRAENAGETG